MVAKKRKDSNAYLPPSTLPQFKLEALSVSGGIAAAAQTLLHSRYDDQGVNILSKQVPDVIVTLLASSGDLRFDVSSHLLSRFPSGASTFLASPQFRVLEALASAIGGIAPPDDVDRTVLKELPRRVRCATQAIEAISSMGFDDYEKYTPVAREPISPKKQKVSRNQLKRDLSEAARRETLDAEVFEVFRVGLPTSREERDDRVEKFLMSQRDCLEHLIDMLENESIQSAIIERALGVVAAPAEGLPMTPSPKTSNMSAVPEMTVAHAGEVKRVTYPTISPDKARISFEWPANFGQWCIYISSTAFKHLRQFRRADKAAFKIIQEKIVQLSQGFFSGSNQKRLEGARNDVPIFEAKMTSDLRLIYQIDIDVDCHLKVDKQVIRIYGIYTHAQFDHRLWSRVGLAMRRTDRRYIQMINYRVDPPQRGVGVNNVTTPMSWPHSDGPLELIAAPDTNEATLSEEQCLELHRIISLEKFIPYSKGVLRSILQDVDAMHPFSLSPTEMKIIQHLSSCFVIGRSGTGKTTTMLFKLLQFEEARRQSLFEGGSGQIRQVFLTQSHILASKVEEYYHQLSHALQLGVSAESGASAGTTVAKRHLTKLEDEADHRSDLPERYSDLKDEHFPLFVTYDQLRRMLENEYGIQWHRSSPRKAVKRADRAKIMESNLLDLVSDDIRESPNESQHIRPLHRGAMTFAAFKAHYWSHMDQKWTKGLDPSQVYSEILGVICSSEDTLKRENGRLDRESYCNLSHRSHSAFASDRNRIYDIFEKYLKLKHTNNTYDSPDRTREILKKLDQNTTNIDFLYVDEVQDLLILDTKLLRDLCPNPNGHFWGGDTAQTISVGSSFRFDDLKALVYREELRNPLVESKARQPVNPEVFELLFNYRSHGGIVACAASIIDLISSMFPYSIDKLQREASMVEGPKPRVFRDNVVHWEMFVCDSDSGNNRLDFGARQVIIVRDVDARNEVREAIGDAGLVLTLLESKGLEFDDVMLYNFFGSSPASAAQWRVVETLNADPHKHRVIESELKRLYVAITRARHSIWLWDPSNIAEPMLNYWISHDLIHIHDPSEPLPHLATKSTPEEWEATGRTMFAKANYTQAASCFEKAQRLGDRDMSLAYQLRKDAREVGSDAARSALFKSAAHAFESCAEAELKGTEERRSLHRLAGECFLECQEYALAGANFESADAFTEAAVCFHKAQLLEDAARLVYPPDGSESLVDESVRGTILDSIKLQYLRANNLELAGPLFVSAEEEVEFVSDFLHESSELLVAIHKQEKDFVSAAGILSRAGQDKEAAKCLVLSGNSEARELAATSLLRDLWSQAFFVEDLSILRESWDILDTIPKRSLGDVLAFEVDVFRAVVSEDLAGLCDLARRAVKKHSLAVILTINHALRRPFNPATSQLDALSNRISLIDTYCRQIIFLLRDHRLCDSPRAGKLFGFRQALDERGEAIQNETYVGPASQAKRLVERAMRTRQDITVVSMRDGSLNVHSDSLNILLRENLESVARRHLEGLHEELKTVAILRPCLEYALRGICGRRICDRFHSKPPSSDILKYYYRVHMQVVAALEGLWHVPNTHYEIRGEIQRVWVERIYEVLFPLIGVYGDCLLVHTRYPESDRALPIIRNWIEHCIRMLNPYGLPHQNERFPSDAVRLVTMAYVFNSGRLPPYFWHGMRLFRPHPDVMNHRLNHSIMQDMIRPFVSDAQYPIIQGLTFLQWAVEKCASIDLNILIHYLERLALQIIFDRLRKRVDPFHNVLLPHAWALLLLQSSSQTPPAPLKVYQLTGPVISLLRAVNGWNGYGQFTFQRSRFPTSWPFRHEIISRICRALVLVGFHGHEWQSAVYSTIHSLDRSQPHGDPYLRYARSTTWWDLVRTMVFHGGQDRFILLRNAGAPKSIEGLSMVPRVVFKDLDDLRSKLTRADGNGEAAPTGPQATLTGEPQTDHPEPTERDTESGEQLDETEPIPVAPEEIPDQLPESAGTEVINATRTDEGQTHFVIRLQRCYRRYRTRRELVESSVFHKLYQACVVSAQGITLGQEKEPKHRSHYLAVLRGPLPHVLLVLSSLLTLIRKTKNAAKRRLSKINPGPEMERCIALLSILNAAYRDVSGVQKKIEPGSDAFCSGSSNDLKTHVTKAKELLDNSRAYLKPADVTTLEEDMAIAFKGIVEDPVPPRKEEMPSLNTDDLDYV